MPTKPLDLSYIAASQWGDVAILQNPCTRPWDGYSEPAPPPHTHARHLNWISKAVLKDSATCCWLAVNNSKSFCFPLPQKLFEIPR